MYVVEHRQTFQSQNMTHNKISSIMKLIHLPLRPSTLSLLTRKGFHSTADVDQSFSFGISNFASELGVVGSLSSTSVGGVSLSIQDVMKIKHEIDDAVHSVMNGYSHKYGQGNTKETSSAINRNNIPIRGVPQTAAQILASHYNQNSNNSNSSSNNTNTGGSSTRPIISFVKSIDTLLGGGFHSKQVIEISGLPGVGKTQLAMQLCVDATLPFQFGGNRSSTNNQSTNSGSGSGSGSDNGIGCCHSIYIDSEGSFSPERCHDMANALVTHITHSAKKRKRYHSNTHYNQHHYNEIEDIIKNYTSDMILDCINVFRVLDETCQSATIYSLPKYLKQMKDNGKDVKLIVIDSIAFHYRCSSTDYKSRTKSLTSVTAFLSDLANTFDLCVVLINQMTTKIGGNNNNQFNDNSTGSSNTNVIPALGESFAHATTTRLLLTFDNSNDDNEIRGVYDEYGIPGKRRVCKLVKSPHRPAGIAYFCVTEFGLRDIPVV